ncbi:MAG: uroporphyrinogen-III C-methyltransferase, partial [Natronospirillum sp.]
TADRNTGADTTKSASHDGGGPPPERRRASSGGRGTFLAIILLLIFLAALGATAWWAHGQWLSFQQDWQVTETSWQEEREQLRGSIGQVETRLSQRENDMADLGSEVDQTRNDLINLATQVNEQAALQDSDIQRLEIEYLLRTARHLSLLTGDLRQAENLLRQADRMLAEFEDLAYLPVREALAQDIQRLREIPMPDVNGLYFELQALAERSLDWQWWPETADLTQQTGEPQAVSDTWYSQVWAEIKDLITVRYRDDANQERLTPSEFNYLQGQFRLLMNQAQVALMQGNQTLYRASLEQAMNWLSTGISQVPQADQVLAQLETLQAQTVAVETPEIDRGLTRLQQMIADAEG